MNPLVAKYLAEDNGRRDELHGGPICGYSALGYPIRGTSAPLLTSREDEELPIVADFRWRIFNTWDAESMEFYRRIQDRIANHVCFLRHIDRQPVPDKGGWTIYMEWIHVYSVVDPAAAPMGAPQPFTPAPGPPAGFAPVDANFNPLGVP